MNEGTAARPRSRTRSLALIGALSVLLAQFVVWAGPTPAQVSSPLLYGADGANCNEFATLYTINPATGAKTAAIGPIGFAVSGLAVDPTTGQLYGSTGNCDDPRGALLKINKATGEGTLINFPIVDDCDSGMHDLTFTTDGQLWGWSHCADTLVKINKVTGEGEEVGTGIGAVENRGNGLAADPDDNTLWFTPDRDDGEYFTVDKATGAGTSQGTLDGDNDGPINSLAWSCDGETLFGTANGSAFQGGGPREFITINTATDHITVLGDDVDQQQDAIAWDCAPPQPVVQCKGKAATLVGTSGKDTLTGTSGKDVIAGRGGNDKISAQGGKDTVCGGEGNDKANGGGGNDRLLGQAGNDNLKGAGGKDNLKGGGGNDRCNGGPGTDKGNCESESSIP
jgi:RTX calcium-binding nonapeptide repeat (4 copies)